MHEFMNHDFIVTRITYACKVPAGTGAYVHNNRKYHGLALFPDGERTFTFEGKTRITAAKNTIIYFPKGSNYVIDEKESSDCYAINFETADDTTFAPFAFKAKKIAEYMQSFTNCDKIWTRKKTAYMSKVRSEFYNIIYHMQSEYDMPYHSGSGNKIKPAIDYIAANYNRQNISVVFLAGLCGMSTATLRNCFLNEFGVSTLKYINNMKISLAKELLETKMYSVSKVCFLSGFRDECCFSREFKKATGIPPSKYE